MARHMTLSFVSRSPLRGRLVPLLSGLSPFLVVASSHLVFALLLLFLFAPLLLGGEFSLFLLLPPARFLLLS